MCIKYEYNIITYELNKHILNRFIYGFSDLSIFLYFVNML